MLSWWAGQSQEPQDRDGQLPETPAPKFAIRALRQAGKFFGNPEIGDEDTVVHIEESTTRPAATSPAKQTTTARTPKAGGILVTPGTANARRKTVSFGNGVLDNEFTNGRPRTRKTDGATPNSSPFESTSTSRKTSLTRKLEESRVKLVEDACATGNLAGGSTAGEDIDASHIDSDDIERSQDLTMDLNEPLSESGRYWKNEYTSYHQEAVAQMKKLVRYKQLAKTYAQQKDEEALEIAERLDQEQQAAAELRNQVSRLTAQLAAQDVSKRLGDGVDVSEELARQTALVERYRAELKVWRGNHHGEGPEKQELALPADIRQRLQAEEQLKEEMVVLKNTLHRSERLVVRLRRENSRLTDQIQRAKARYREHSARQAQKAKAAEEPRPAKASSKSIPSTVDVEGEMSPPRDSKSHLPAETPRMAAFLSKMTEGNELAKQEGQHPRIRHRSQISTGLAAPAMKQTASMRRLDGTDNPAQDRRNSHQRQPRSALQDITSKNGSAAGMQGDHLDDTDLYGASPISKGVGGSSHAAVLTTARSIESAKHLLHENDAVNIATTVADSGPINVRGCDFVQPSRSLDKEKGSNLLGSDSRLSMTGLSSRRTSLTADRAAAARARLDQKKANKKRASLLGTG